jgi:hypothetical protein
MKFTAVGDVLCQRRMAKDYDGFAEVKAFIEQHPNLYPYLYYGSISTYDIPLLRDEIEHAHQAGAILFPPFLK